MPSLTGAPTRPGSLTAFRAETTQQFVGTTIGNDVRGDLPRETRHPREQPRRRATGVQRQMGEAGATGHVRTYGQCRLGSSGCAPGLSL